MSNGIRQKCRLLLEGREVPFISATLICNVGEPIKAIIDLVPLQAIKTIQPKTQVHIFVQDQLNFGDLNFYEAFEGEVVGRGMGKSDKDRSFQIVAVDYSGYWDEAKAYFLNPNYLVGKLEDLVSGDVAPSTVAKAAAAPTFTGNSTANSLMINMILNKKNPDLIAGVASVFTQLNKVNQFYSAAWSRLRINDRVRVFTGGKVNAFLSQLNLDEFLLGFTGRQGGMESMRTMLTSVMNLIFHDFISVPFPSKVDAYVNGTVAGETIGNFLFAPDGYSLPPPKCNVIFPNQIKKFEFSDDFRAAPTRFAFRATLPQVVDQATGVSVYPLQYYPDGFKDYMFKSKTETATELSSLLGTCSIMEDKNGNTYSDVKYGQANTNAVGTSASPTLREADFLTNDEAIRGIFFDMETLMPGMTTLAKVNSAASVRSFTQSIGTYLFYKKRFAARNASAELMFHPFLVPGFNTILVDDSDSAQSFIAKVQTVTHTLSNQGCSTTVSLGYARDFDEVDALTGDSTEPPLPAWFDSNIFGAKDSTGKVFQAETEYLAKLGLLSQQEYDARLKIKNATVYTNFSQFYQKLFSTDSVTDIDADTDGNNQSKIATVRGAAVLLTELYKKWASKPGSQDDNVRNYISRPVPTMAETMYFLGAQPLGDSGIIPDEFAFFEAVSSGPAAGRFDGDGFPDGDVLNIRRGVIDAYVDLLQTKVGFRG